MQLRDFHNQLIIEQNMWQEVSNTLQELRRELETIRADQYNQNQMDVSLNMDATAKANCIKQKAEEEWHLAKEWLAKAKANHKQALRDKSCEVTVKIKCIK